MHKLYKGQSLTEILIALAIGVAFINVGILAMATSNILAKVNKANNFALSLLKSQRSIIETITDNGWHSIADLTIGKHYKLAKQNNSWVVQQGEEKVFDEKAPVAQWNFDEESGTTAYDNAGTNSGTLISSPTWLTESNCVSGGCLGFNGVNGYVNVDNATSLNITNAITIEAWIKTSTATDDHDIVQKWAAAGQYSYKFYQSGTQLRFSISTDGTVEKAANTDNNFFSVGNWTHTVVTYNGSTWIAYKNGQPFQTYGSITGTMFTGTSPVIIGPGANGLWDEPFIDEVRVYDYVLTESQVKQHYNAGLNRLGLVSQWGMDEGSGVTTYDSQSTHDGTLTNGPTWKLGADCVGGGCLNFDGVDDYVAIGVGNDYFPLSLFTVCAWVKTSGLAPGMTMNGILSLTYGLDLDIDNQLLKARLDNGSTLVEVWGKNSLYDNKFHNVCMVYDGTYLKAFVDGVFNNQTATAWSGTSRWPTTLCVIGTDTNNISSYMFNGFIDDVRIYNRALSADELANAYKDGYTKYFYVNNVSRDIASDPTASTHNLETTYKADHDDPNTKKITNVTRYLLGTPGRVNTQEQYLARASNINSLIQTDWSGNSGVAGPEIDFGNNYYSTSNLTLSTSGQIYLTSAASNGNLISSIIDTQSINGSGYFNILWQGDALCSGCSVKFQIAASNSNAGPWTYYGPTATSDYYIPSGPGVPVPITYAGQYLALSASVQNKRYVRYQITLVPASSLSPVVKNVIINYAP